MKKIALLLAMILVCSTFALAEGAGAGMTGTTVFADPDSPTGYTVAFRLPDNNYSRVRLYGEWAFTDVNHVSRVTSENKTPYEWEAGDFVCCNGASWQTTDMVLTDGVWALDMPLPNGSFNYRFVIGGAADAAVTDTTDTTMMWDPSNRPFHADFLPAEQYVKGDDLMSTIYVPFDPEKQIDDFTIEAPRESENGTIAYYPLNDEAGHALQVYLPYGYDENLEGGYKVLYLAANAATNTWFGLGVAGNILDNAIAEGLMDPVVAVCTAYSDYATITDLYIPYIMENFNVSADKEDWAITSYSASGMNSTYAIFDHDHFGWCAPQSTYANAGMLPENADFTDPALKEKHILYVQAMFETYWGSIMDENPILLSSLYENGILPTTCWPYGTHAWSVWRQGLAYMCTEWLWK